MTDSLVSDLPSGYSRGPLGEWKTLPWPDDPEEKARLMEMSLGPQVIDWAEWRTDEPGLLNDEGERWRFTDGQARFIILWYAFDDAGRYVYRSGLKRAAKGPIAHDTPVMTPDGWTTHGELRPGSVVYAEDGTPTRVVDLRPEVLDPMYRVRFRNGGHVDCTGSHRWPVEVFTGRSRRERQVMTVDEMLSLGVYYERPLTSSSKAKSGRVARFKSLPSPVIDGPNINMPIDPYVIGYWLGDGDKDCPRITANREDMEALALQMDALGVEHGEMTHTHGDTYRMRFGRGVAASWLRSMGMLNDKHIPGVLLRASAEQRWALLQGIVDSDGTVSKSGTVEVSLKDDRLADDVFELAVSLGLMPTATVGRTYFGGREYSRRKRIRFTPMAGEVVSRLPRKQERTVRARAHAVPFSRSRTIVGIERIESRPARCITVEHDSHVYLVGDRNVPTCNTGKDPFGAAMCNIEFLGPSQLDFDVRRGGWYGKRHHMPLVQVASNSADQSKKLLRVANSQLGSEAVDYYQLDKGMTATYVKNSPARMEIITNSESSAEGDPATFIVLNESHHMTPNSGRDEIAAVVRRNAGKSKGNIQARVLELTNAHMKGAGSVAEETYIAWQKQQSDSRFVKDILYDSVESDPRLDFYDADERRLAIRQAYSDAPWADIDRLCSEIIDPRLSAAEAIRFYLNGLADAEDAFVGAQEFMALADPSKGLKDGDRIALFLDCSKSEDATAMMACRIDDGFNQTVGVWQRPRGKRGEGYLVPREDVDAAVRGCFERFRVVWFGVDPSPAKDDTTEASYWQPLIDQWHRDFRRRLRIWATPGQSSVLFDMRLSAKGGAERNRLFSAETEVLRDLIDVEGLDGPFRHDGHTMLVAHVNNARARLNKFGLIIGKVTRDSSANVDAAVAMIGANVGRRLALNSGRVRTRSGGGRGGRGGRVMVMS